MANDMSNNDDNESDDYVYPPVQLNAKDIIEVNNYVTDEDYNVIGYSLKIWLYTSKSEITWTPSLEPVIYAINQAVYENHKTTMSGYLVSKPSNRPKKIKSLWNKLMKTGRVIQHEKEFKKFS